MTHRARIVVALTLAATLAATPSALRACAFDNESQDFSLDTLDHYYPGAYQVVLRMVEARRDGTLTRLIDPNAQKLFSLQRLLRAARGFEAQVRAAAQAPGVEPPPTSVLLVDSMLWVRLPADIATRPAQMHVPQPSLGDLVVVMGDDALGAIVNGKLDLAEAEQRGLMQFHGSGPAIADFRRAYANVGLKTAPAVR